MTRFPTFLTLLLVFLFIQMAVGSITEWSRLNMMLSVLSSKLDATQLEVKFLHQEIQQLRDELHQARQHSDGLMVNKNWRKMNDSGENKCSCETIGNLSNELQDIRHNGINNSERISKLESFSESTDELQDLVQISSTSKELANGFRQEKQLRKDFEIKIMTRFLTISGMLFNMNQTCQSCTFRTDKDVSIEKEMNSTLHRLLVDVEEIKSSIRNIENDTHVLSSISHSQSAILANSTITTKKNYAEIRQIYSELQSLKDLIASLSRGKTPILETTTTSSKPATGSTSKTSDLCARTVTDETLIQSSIKVGSRVVRGRDWLWGTQDGVPPTAGTVEKVDSLPGWVWVRWDSGMYVNYRIGNDKKFDLYICE